MAERSDPTAYQLQEWHGSSGRNSPTEVLEKFSSDNLEELKEAKLLSTGNLRRNLEKEFLGEESWLIL